MKTGLGLLIFGAALNIVGAPVGLDNMEKVKKFDEVAPGIWKFTIGDTAKESAYTDFTARPPRMEALKKRPSQPPPFKPEEIRYTITDGFNIGLRIPSFEEDIYGFGLQFNALKQNKRILDLRMDHWGGGDGRTHAPVPFYISTKGYGVFVNTARPLKVYPQVGNRKDDPHFPITVDRNPPPDEKQPGGWDSQPCGESVEIHADAKGLEVYIFTGESLQDIVAAYNLYMGGGALPPLWGLGFWHRVPAKYTAQQCDDEITEFAKRNIPLDVLGLEPGWMTKSYPCTFEWQTKRFPDPAAFVGGLLKKGIRVNLWENPYISSHGKLYSQMFPYAATHTVWLGIAPDYTLPEAREFLVRQHTADHIDIGVSGYKVDETDGYDKWLWPDHARFPSGTSGKVMRQLYGLSLQKTYEDGIFRKKNIRSMGMTRSTSGGASAYANAIYSDAYSHSQYITGISAASLCGVLWCPEIRSAGNPTEWLCRMQTAAFSPVMQLNAWASGTKPWSYKEKEKEIRELIEWRMRFLPYLYNAYAQYERTGIPPFRAMILESGYKVQEVTTKGKLDHTLNPYEAAKTSQIMDQYMMGESIMVAPFYEKQSTKRKVVLPKGDWYDFYTGEFAGNDKTINLENDGRMPLFVRDGALIPLLQNSVMTSDAAYGQPLEIRHYGKRPGTLELYEDDGKTYNYEKGEYRLRTFSVDQGTMTEKETKRGPAMFGGATLKSMTK